MNVQTRPTPPLSVSTEKHSGFSIFFSGNSMEFMIRVLRSALGVVPLLGILWPLFAQNIPSLTLSMGDAKQPNEVAMVFQVLFLITILALAPSILIMLTSFVRIVIVFSFLRRALGTQTMPPDQVMIGLALFLTFFIMTPVFSEINETAIQPYLAEEVDFREGVSRALEPVRTFMLRQVNEKDLALFVQISNKPSPRNVDDLGMEILLPAFVTGELRTAFIIGFILYVPFLVIDMVVASVLLSMGMMMLPPVMISLPFKIILFVLIDGWHLIIKQLVVSFG